MSTIIVDIHTVMKVSTEKVFVPFILKQIRLNQIKPLTDTNKAEQKVQISKLTLYSFIF